LNSAIETDLINVESCEQVSEFSQVDDKLEVQRQICQMQIGNLSPRSVDTSAWLSKSDIVHVRLILIWDYFIIRGKSYNLVINFFHIF